MAPNTAHTGASESSGGVSSCTASAGAGGAGQDEDGHHRDGSEAALEQRPEDADGHQRHERVAELVAVQERRDEPAPDLVVGEPALGTIVSVADVHVSGSAA